MIEHSQQMFASWGIWRGREHCHDSPPPWPGCTGSGVPAARWQTKAAWPWNRWRDSGNLNMFSGLKRERGSHSHGPQKPLGQPCSLGQTRWVALIQAHDLQVLGACDSTTLGVPHPQLRDPACLESALRFGEGQWKRE